ncbi:hypothetical protein EON63_06310 [archaeon]|nr:MAG: hypothetical protein EON63_06310 [archaeon]
MAYDAKDLPNKAQEDKTPPATDTTTTTSSPDTAESFVSDPETASATPPPNDDELAEIMERLQSSKFGSPKVFRPEDFAGLSQEEMAEKVRQL